MTDVTIGRRAGAGMMMKQREQEPSARRAGRDRGQHHRGDLDDADQTPKKPSVRRASSVSTDDDDDLAASPTRRQPLYPSNLTHVSTRDGSPNSTPKARRPVRPNRKDDEPVTYQTLDSLLRAAGYRDTRIVTPESERIQARVASEKRRREESGLPSEDEDDEIEVERLTNVAQAEAGENSSPSRPFPSEQASKGADVREPVRVEAGGWWAWASLGNKAGADALDRLGNPTNIKPSAITRRRSALDMNLPAKHAPGPKSSPPHMLSRAFTSPPDSPSPRTRRQPTEPMPASKRVSSLSSTECGSMSSSLSTNASTMIASPPDVPSRSFRPMEGSPILDRDHTTEDGARQWSPPRGRNVGPVVVRGSERLSEVSRADERAQTLSSRSADKSDGDQPLVRKRDGSRTGDTRSRSRPAVEKGKKVAITLDEDSLANSMAARSLRNISSQAALRDAASSGARIKPEASLTFGSSSAASSSSSSSGQAAPRRTLRHAASTPFFSSGSSSGSGAPPPLPPLPTNSTQAVKQSWFSTVSRNLFPTSIAQPTSTDTAFRQTANARIRTRPSIPSFHPSTNASVPTPTTSLSSVSPRTDPLPTQVTQQTVLCSSEAADDGFGPSTSMYPGSQASGQEAPAVQAAPILSTKSSFSSVSSASTSAGAEGGDAWKKNLKGGGVGWTWNVSTAMEEDLSFWSAPSPTYPTADDAPTSRPLQAKRSIKSLRAALAASDLAESLLNAPPMPTPKRTNSAPMVMSPPPPPPEIVISSPGTFEAGIAPRVLDLDEEQLECFGGSASRRRSPVGSRGSGRVIRKKSVV